MNTVATVELLSYAAAMAALKHPDLHQGLYDEGARVMADALITLHGTAHAQRRVVEFGVFGRGYFRHYEQDVFPQTLEPILESHLHAGRTELVDLGYQVTMTLTADFAGIDRAPADPAATANLLALVKTFSEGATLVHSTRDPQLVNAEVDQALQRFDSEYLQPSIERRQRLIAQGEALPKDVLSQLLVNAEKLNLTPEVLRREIAFYLQAGAHSTANSTVHALHEIFTWCESHSQDYERLLADPAFLQRCVHESLRLHPASPVAWRRAARDIELAGKPIAQGTKVVIDLVQANREPAVFGSDADRFNPGRKLARNTWPFGLTFGYGNHACLGRDLDGGVVPKSKDQGEVKQLGIVSLFVQRLLAAGARRIPGDPPTRDPNTQRGNWGRYPLQFAQAESKSE